MNINSPLARIFAHSFARAAALASALLAAPGLHAVTYYWDNNGSTGGFGTAGGTWAAPTTNDATQGWSTSSTGVNAMSGNTTTTTADALNFGTSTNGLAAGTITVSGNVSASTITIVGSSSNITLAGGNITLNGGLTVTNSANTTAINETISSNITLGGSQTWTLNNGGTVGTQNLDVSGNILGGANGLTKSGNGTLTLSGAANSWNGTTTVSAGTLTLSGNLSTTGTIGITSTTVGVLNVTGNLTQTKSANVRNFVIAGSANSNGTVNVSGSGILNATGMYLGEDGGGNAVLNQSGGTVTSTGEILMGGKTSTLNVSGGVFNMGTQQLTLGAGNLAGGSNSTLTVNGTGSITMGNLRFGFTSRNATAMIVNLGDGTAGGNLTITGMSYIAGAGSGPSTINFNGGMLTANNTISMITQASTVVKAGGAVINVLPTRTFTISNNLTDGGGGGGLTKEGTGTLLLSGAGNNYTGTTTVNAGTLQINHANALGTTGNITFGGGALRYNTGITQDLSSRIKNSGSAILVDTNGNNVTFANAIDSTNSGGLTKNGTGTLTLSVANSYTGTTTVNGGTLALGADQDLGAIAGAGALDLSSYTLATNATSDTTYSGVISGTGGLTKNGTGTLTLSNAGNTYTGTTIVNAGTLALGASQNLGVIAGAGALNLSSYSLTTNATSDSTYSGVISGTGSLTKNGAGTLTLSNTNTYNGSTTINAGTLQIDGNMANSGLVINSGAIISPSTTATADSFGTSSITINSGGYNWTLSSANGSAGFGWDQITSTGALTSSGLMTIYAYGTPGDWDNSANYSWNIFSAASLSGAFDSAKFVLDLSNFGIAAANRTGTWSFSNPSGGNITLSYAASGDPVWTGGTGDFSTGFTPAASNGDDIAFSGTGGTATNDSLSSVNNLVFRAGAGAYTIAGTALTVNGSIYNNSTTTQTFSTAPTGDATFAANAGGITISGIYSGSGSLTKTGLNTLTLSNNNTYTGTTTINAGTLQIGSGSTSGALSASSAITNNANLVFNRADDLTVTNTITGSGNLTQAGAGILMLSGASSNYTGTTTINAGTIQIGHASALGSGGNITFGGGGLKYGTGITIDLSSRIKNSGSAILVDTNGQTVTWATNLETTNSGGLTKNGTGTLILTAANTNTGGTTVNAGTLQIGNNSNNNAAVQGTTTLSGGNLSYNYNGSNFAVNGAITLTAEATISKLGSFQMNFSSGTLNGNGQTLNISVAGNTPIYFNQTAGTSLGQVNILSGAVGQDGTLGRPLRNATMNISSGAQFRTYSTATINNNITLNGGSGVNGNGALYNEDSSALATYSGTITLADATNSTIGSANGSITISGQVTGNGSLTKNNTFTLTLSGNNTYTGTTIISVGTLSLSGGRAIADISSVSVSSGAVLNLSASETVGSIAGAGNITLGANTLTSGGDNSSTTLTGVISGAGGGLTKNGTGTLVVPMSSTYNGTTTVNGGILRIENLTTNRGSDLTSTPGSVYNINNGSTLVLHSNVGGNNRVASNNDTFTFGSNGGGTLEWSQANFLLQGGGNTHQFTTTGGLQNIITTTNAGYLNGQGGGTANFTVADGSDAVDLLVSGSLNNILITKNGTGTISIQTHSTNGSYAITIQEGTLDIGGSATLAGGAFSATLTNNGTFSYSSSAAQTLSGIITGTGSLTKNGSGTLTLANASNNYSGGTILNTGTLVIGHANAVGTDALTQSSGPSLLKIDTTGTITNAMSVYNVQASQNATLSGAITVHNATWDIDEGDTLTISGNISGTGGTTKNGTGTLVLSGNNSNTGATTVNAGTLTAASTKSLGATSGVVVNNGGSILVTAEDAINDSANVTLNGGTLAVDGTFNESVGLLTLSANSVIDLDGYAGTLRFNGVGSWAAGAILSIWNWNGINQYGTPVGDGANTRHVVFTDATGLGSYLNRISFYSGSGTGFAGTAFEQGFSGGGTEIRVVPEPGTYITAAILLAFCFGLWVRPKRAQKS